MRRLFPFLLFTLAALSAGAQNRYLAYHVTGDVLYKKKGRQVALKTGEFIADSTMLIVRAKASVEFICNGFALIEIKKEGLFTMRTFLSQCVENTNSITGNFLKFVWHQVSSHEKEVEEQHREFMTNTAAVERGRDELIFNGIGDTVRYFRAPFAIKWSFARKVLKREIVVFADSNSKKPLLIMPLTADSVQVGDIAAKLNGLGVFYWAVKAHGKEMGKRKLLEILNESQFSSFCDSLKKNIGLPLERASENYMLGHFLEDAYLYGEAYYRFAEAYNSMPGNIFYKKSVSIFRKRYNIN